MKIPSIARSTIFLIALLIAIVGCSRSNPTGSGDVHYGYFPLRAGSWWRYSQSSGDGMSFTSDSLRKDVIGTLPGPDGNPSTAVQVQTYDTMLMPGHNPSGIDTSYYRKLGSSLEVYNEYQSTWILVHRYPLTIGAAWLVTPQFDSLYWDSVRIVAQETVIVPAGTFYDCVKLKDWNNWWSDYQHYTWLAPNVGLVKESTAVAPIAYGVRTLRSYRIAH